MIPRWYQLALEELATDVKEVPGRGNHPSILKYQAATGYNAQDDEVPWCSSFVAWCFRESKVPYNFGPAAAAKSWLTDPNFKSLKKPILGAVGVKSRTGGNHVVFFSKWIDKEAGTIQVLEGNASNRLKFGTYRNDVFQWVWPKNEPIPMASTPTAKSAIGVGTITTGAAGTLVAAKGLQDIVTPTTIADVKDTVITAAPVAREMAGYLSTSGWLTIGLGVVIIALAAYILWSRFNGAKKDRVVAGE